MIHYYGWMLIHYYGWMVIHYCGWMLIHYYGWMVIHYYGWMVIHYYGWMMIRYYGWMVIHYYGWMVIHYYGWMVIHYYGWMVIRYYGWMVIHYYGWMVIHYYGWMVIRYYGWMVIRYYGWMLIHYYRRHCIVDCSRRSLMIEFIYNIPLGYSNPSFSRRILWLKLAHSNNNPNIIAAYFLQGSAVYQDGCWDGKCCCGGYICKKHSDGITAIIWLVNEVLSLEARIQTRGRMLVATVASKMHSDMER
ncbi:hypothetical protein MAR_030037 [Mya arenaria]|uniref:Uncharacterized protein n=1 Tax=Mya arenaria TaxID=6604 RepID=A0ABY7DI38_MYAAR|nr:hypothetical protein MAR_030037 [Mya arenaria]